MKKALCILLILLSGCATYQEWKPGQKAGFTFASGCEKLTIGSGIKYSKCFK